MIKNKELSFDEFIQRRDRNIASLEEDFEQAEADLKDIQMLNYFKNHYQELALVIGHLFEAEIGASGIRKLLEKINLGERLRI